MLCVYACWRSLPGSAELRIKKYERKKKNEALLPWAVV